MQLEQPYEVAKQSKHGVNQYNFFMHNLLK